MKAQDIKIGSTVQFDDYGTGTHKGACADCMIAPATVTVPAVHSFDENGKPNGSKETVCAPCADKHIWCFTCDRPKADCGCVENGGNY